MIARFGLGLLLYIFIAIGTFYWLEGEADFELALWGGILWPLGIPFYAFDRFWKAAFSGKEETS